MKILNLYSGIGGNRQKWVGEITAVELDPNIAEVYRSLYPNDTVIIGDAHEYLEKHYADFDVIWSSPPCQSHGQYRHNVGVIGKGFKPLMPDMSLYAEIIFLQTYFEGRWIVENTKPYYKPLIEPSFTLQRHLFWASSIIPNKSFKSSKIRSKNKISDFDNYEVVKCSKIKNKRQVLRNCTEPVIGQYILKSITKRTAGSKKFEK